ncbi:MAG: hypothetical protein RL357_535, partial [Pseudomonadota bacterium]
MVRSDHDKHMVFEGKDQRKFHHPHWVCEV